MASLSRVKGGKWIVQYVDPSQKRRTISLGKMDRRTADHALLMIDRLIASHVSGLPLDQRTAAWAAEVKDPLAGRLASLGLLEKVATVTLEVFLSDIRQMNSHLRPNTLKNYDSTIKKLVEFFGGDRLMKAITPGDCDRWKAWMERERKLAPATVSRDLKRAKQFFRSAMRDRLIDENPMADMKASAQVNPERFHYISNEDINRVLEECPNTEWKLLVALCRFGGLRCPTEIVPMTWDDILWDKDLFIVQCVKNQRHGRKTRHVPIFPEIRPYLENAFEEAEEGSVRVFTEIDAANQNRRTRFHKIILRAGIEPWPRIFHNLRASLLTDVATKFPPHLIKEFFDASPEVAMRHYQQILPSHVTTAASRGISLGFSEVPQETRETWRTNAKP